MRKPIFASAKTKVQIRGAVTMRLVSFSVFATYTYTHTTFKIRNVKPLDIFCGFLARFVLYLVGNPENRLCRDTAQILLYANYN